MRLRTQGGSAAPGQRDVRIQRSASLKLLWQQCGEQGQVASQLACETASRPELYVRKTQLSLRQLPTMCAQRTAAARKACLHRGAKSQRSNRCGKLRALQRDLPSSLNGRRSDLQLPRDIAFTGQYQRSDFRVRLEPETQPIEVDPRQFQLIQSQTTRPPGRIAEAYRALKNTAIRPQTVPAYSFDATAQRQTVVSALPIDIEQDAAPRSPRPSAKICDAQFGARARGTRSARRNINLRPVDLCTQGTVADQFAGVELQSTLDHRRQTIDVSHQVNILQLRLPAVFD